jgi:hypothetical protein
VQGVDVVSPPNVVRWVRKPSVVQFNAGRVEFSMPYQVGIAILLGALLVVVVVFRLGERLGSREAAKITPTTVVVAKQPTSSPQARQGQIITPATVAPGQLIAGTGVANQPTAASMGRNRIVIKIYQVQAHLEPVKEYFDRLGVATDIIERNNLYYLVTKNRYDNPDRPGTDGYLAKQKIIEIGAGYKAPVGYETFGPKPFSDAFGMRFEE